MGCHLPAKPVAMAATVAVAMTAVCDDDAIVARSDGKVDLADEVCP